MSAIAASSLKQVKKVKSTCPEPYVAFRKHPIKWTHFFLQTKLYQIIMAHVGLFAIAGLYFFVLQQEYDFTVFGVHIHIWLKHWWDHLFGGDWHTIRHLIRDCGEGFLGTLLALMLVTNYYKIKDNAINRFMMKLSSSPLIVLTPFIIILAALPGFALGYGVLEALKALIHAHSLNPTLSAHPSFIAKLYADDTDAKIVGIFGGVLFGHKAAMPVFATIQRFFAERRVAKGKKDRFYQPVYFRALVRQMAKDHSAKTAAATLEDHGILLRVAIAIAIIALLGFAYEGYYVLHHFA